LVVLAGSSLSAAAYAAGNGIHPHPGRPSVTPPPVGGGPGGHGHNPFGDNWPFGNQNSPFGHNWPFGDDNSPFGQNWPFGPQNSPFGQNFPFGSGGSDQQ
jgi:hypothetical protein